MVRGPPLLMHKADKVQPGLRQALGRTCVCGDRNCPQAGSQGERASDKGLGVEAKWNLSPALPPEPSSNSVPTDRRRGPGAPRGGKERAGGPRPGQRESTPALGCRAGTARCLLCSLWPRALEAITRQTWGAAGGRWAALPCFQAPPRPGPSLPGFCSWAALRPEQTPPHLTAKGEQGQGCVGTCRPSRSLQLPNHLVGHPLRLS